MPRTRLAMFAPLLLVLAACEPDAVRPSSPPTPSATPASTAAASATSAAVTAPAVILDTAQPKQGQPFGGTDVIAALRRIGIDARPLDYGYGCGTREWTVDAQVYGGRDGLMFSLWVFPSPEALLQDWEVSGGVAKARGECRGVTGDVFVNQNLLIHFSPTAPGSTQMVRQAEILGAFRALVPVATTPTTALTTAPADCTPPLALSPSSTDGPYYKAGSPERASLVVAGMAGTRVVITGTVRTTDCKPVARAWLDFWQTDAAGAYDNSGYRLRGHLLADAEGRYRLETIVPGEYPGRTEHIHVKVQAPGGPMWTGQLYFPDQTTNASDGIFQPQMLLRDVQTSGGAMSARFDFVVNAR